MNPGIRIIIFFPIWVIFTGVFYSFLFLKYPETFLGSKSGYEYLLSSNLTFLILNQLASLLAAFSTIFFIYKFIHKQQVTFLTSFLNLSGLAIGLLIGIVEISLIMIVSSFLVPFEIQFNGVYTRLLEYALAFFLVAISEEIVSRGYIFSTLLNKYNIYLSIIVTSLIFSILHIFNTHINLIGIINTVLGGIFLCQLYLIRMDLSIPIGYHFGWNLFQGPLLGFSVSGLEMDGVFSFKQISTNSMLVPEFGLEGSIISTFILLVFSLVIFVFHTNRTYKLLVMRPY